MSTNKMEAPGENMKNFEQLVVNATVALMNKPSLEYFGILSYGLPKKIISKKTYQQLFGNTSLGFTDGKSITFMVSDAADLGDVIFTTIHEILHVISRHVQRCETRDPLMWNLAVDQVVNTVLYDLSRETQFIRWQENCFFDQELYQKNKQSSAEEIYEILMKRANRYTIERIPLDSLGGTGQPQSGGGGGQQPDPNGQPDPNAQNNSAPGKYVIKVTDKQTGKSHYASDDANFVDHNTPQDVKDSLEELAEQARMAWHSNALSKGDIPGGLSQFLDEIFKVEIPWTEILEGAIMYNVQNRQNTTWTWPNECYRAIGLHLPGEYEETAPDTLIASIDSSGSIGDEDLKTFVGILCKPVQYFDKLVVLVHDVNVQQEVDMGDNPSEDFVYEGLKKIMGRGGTSHGPVLKRIGELAEEVRLSCVIFLTDFYSDVQHYALENLWMKEYETVWILNSDINVDLPDGYEFKEIKINGLKKSKK